jgi:hypothetical protein
VHASSQGPRSDGGRGVGDGVGAAGGWEVGAVMSR